MDHDNKVQTRKKFIGVGITAAAMLTAFRFFLPEKKQETGTVKMLTQDGKLVEVDTKKLQEIEKLLCVKSKKVSNDQLQNWVYKK
ncbi:MAG: hypothetical protein NTW54_05805 [Bacteroidetes bacterium]|nr:hypothetical protein [Bacteroidota bacterium]